LVNFPLHQSFFGLTSTYKKDVMYEYYILIKHGGFSYVDILHMPVFERRVFLDILMEENNKVKEHREREFNKAKSKKK
jgi:hypothetical protein